MNTRLASLRLARRRVSTGTSTFQSTCGNARSQSDIPRGYLLTFGNADDGRLGSPSIDDDSGGDDDDRDHRDHRDDRDHRDERHLRHPSSNIPTLVPSLPHSVVGVRLGGAHTLILDEQGTVFACGLNDDGQCGLDGSEAAQVWEPEEVPVPEDVTRVAAGHRSSYAVGRERVWRWGGEGGTGLPRVVPLPDGAAAKDVVDVVAGNGYSIIVTVEGRALLYLEGDVDDMSHAPDPVDLCPGTKIVKASAGHYHAALLDDQGIVRLVPNVYSRKVAETLVDQSAHIVHPVRDVACGGGQTLVALEGGGVMAWGQGDALGLGDGEGRRVPTRIRGLDGAEVVSVAAGWKHSGAIDHAGRLYMWGWGGSQGGSISLIESRGSGGGQLGLGDDCDAWAPRVVQMIRMGKGKGKGKGKGGLEIPYEYWRAVDLSLGINHSAVVVEKS